MLIFQPLPNPLFELAGLGFGRIIDDDAMCYTIEHLEDVTAAFTEIGRKNYDSEAISALRDQLEGINLATDLPAVIQAIIAVELPDDFDADGHDFLPCTRCELPIPHGFFTRDNFKLGDRPVHSMETGLYMVMEGIEQEAFSQETGVFLLQQMARADLIASHEQTTQQIMESLPDELRELAENLQPRVSVSRVNIPGFGEGLALDIKIGRPPQSKPDEDPDASKDEPADEDQGDN